MNNLYELSFKILSTKCHGKASFPRECGEGRWGGEGGVGLEREKKTNE